MVETRGASCSNERWARPSKVLGTYVWHNKYTENGPDLPTWIVFKGCWSFVIARRWPLNDVSCHMNDGWWPLHRNFIKFSNFLWLSELLPRLLLHPVSKTVLHPPTNPGMWRVCWYCSGAHVLWLFEASQQASKLAQLIRTRVIITPEVNGEQEDRALWQRDCVWTGIKGRALRRKLVAENKCIQTPINSHPLVRMRQFWYWSWLKDELYSGPCSAKVS